MITHRGSRRLGRGLATAWLCSAALLLADIAPGRAAFLGGIRPAKAQPVSSCTEQAARGEDSGSGVMWRDVWNEPGCKIAGRLLSAAARKYFYRGGGGAKGVVGGGGAEQGMACAALEPEVEPTVPLLTRASAPPPTPVRVVSDTWGGSSLSSGEGGGGTPRRQQQAGAFAHCVRCDRIPAEIDLCPGSGLRAPLTPRAPPAGRRAVRGL